MSSDETPKIEPTLTDAPSIAPEIKPEPVKSEASVAAETPKVEPPKAEVSPEIKVEAKAEPAKAEPKIEAKAETKAEGPTLPLAPQIEPPKAIILRRPEPKAAKPAAQPRASRFALLAACVAIAASIGAIGGSLGVAKFGAILAPHTEPVVAAKDPAADEIKALRDSIAQLRAFTKSLSDNIGTLKTTVNTTTAAANQQSAKIIEAMERIEKAQAEQKKLAQAQIQPAPETTGSIKEPQKQAAATTTPVPMVLGDPPTTLKPPVLHDYIVRRVYDGAALIEGRNGIIEVEIGGSAPGLGRIESIKRQDGRWVVVTARGLILQR
jgi:hypothetical protein